MIRQTCFSLAAVMALFVSGWNGTAHAQAERSQSGLAPPLQEAARPSFAAEESRPWSSGRVALLGAGDLVGNAVLDRSGERVGTVRYVVIGLSQGRAEYVLVGSGGELDLRGRLIAVPWHAFDLTPDGAVRVGASLQTLSGLPKLHYSEVPQLTGGRLVGEITRVLALPADPAGAEGESQPSPSGGASQPNPREQALAVIGEQVEIVAPPRRDTASRLIGTTVYGIDGAPVGEVDEIALESATGRVLYLLVGQSGWLGQSQRWLAAPLEAFHWAPGRWGYALQVDDRAFARLPSLRSDQVPRSVRRSELDRLSAAFGVDQADSQGQRGAFDAMAFEEVKRRLLTQGFERVEWIERSSGTFRAKAVRAGTPWLLEMDAVSGHIGQTQLTPEGARMVLRHQGYSQIGALQRDQGSYTTTGVRDGREFRLWVNGSTGEVAESNI